MCVCVCVRACVCACVCVCVLCVCVCVCGGGGLTGPFVQFSPSFLDECTLEDVEHIVYSNSIAQLHKHKMILSERQLPCLRKIEHKILSEKQLACLRKIHGC